MKIVVVGLGYVGLPLAVELSKHFEVEGVDINAQRINQLIKCEDSTHEVSFEDLKKTKITFLHKNLETTDFIQGDVFIVTVPTPITNSNQPDLSMVMSATEDVGRWLQKGNLVIYESTVYPGVTEELCIGILEKHSNLKHLVDFNVAYSPERINPGDKINTLTTTTKIVSGDTLETLNLVDDLYSKITKTYRASSIKVAEAAKVIENTQRDINIAFMNELSQIFKRLDIDTNDVIDAAASKWNFQAFRPGLVGGHCISVDPYYLSHKAAGHGLITDVILSARRVNDSIPAFIVEQLIKLMSAKRLLTENAQIVIIGCTFKENVPDIRNSKVLKIVELLKEYNIDPVIFDYLADEGSLKCANINVIREIENLNPAAIIYAVPHEKYSESGWEMIKTLGLLENGVVMDLKANLNKDESPKSITLWRP